jgi:hypothetical protein
MTTDLHNAFAAVDTSTSGLAGIIPVGDAFQLAVDEGAVQGSGFYDAKGVFVPASSLAKMDLWWDDLLHASKYGSFLDALVQFGTITGLDPRSLGANESAAQSLGIASTDAVFLESLAAQELNFTAAVPEPANAALMVAGLAALAFLRKRRAPRG